MSLPNNWPFKHQPESLLGELKMLPEETWRERGEKSALALFDSMSKRVPAYQDFLKKHGVNPKQINTIQNLSKLPHVTKENYLRKYTLSQLSWDGEIGKASIINRSSGSSGKPFYWLSNKQQRDEVGEFYDIVFSSMFKMRQNRTLVIIAYGMGSWVAGTTTLLSSIDFMNKHNCTFITPGYNKKEVIEICQDIGQDYDQVVICAYPPLAKEIIDLGKQQGLNWKKLKPKFIFGAEAFSEELRDYMLAQIGSKQPLLDTMNTIGSADAMVIGHETPLSIALRRKICANKKLSNQILGPGRLPTLAQYYPWQKYLQVENDELIITSNGAIPLLRYNIKDNAKIYRYEELARAVPNALPASMRTEFDWKLPFVLLYGKSTNALKFYGAIVYPENIKAALEKPEVAKSFTGKFRMETYLDAKKDQRLMIHIELAPGVNPKAINRKALAQLISQTTCQLNTEYKCVYTDIGRKTVPIVKLANYNKFDLKGVNKHKYVS